MKTATILKIATAKTLLALSLISTNAHAALVCDTRAGQFLMNDQSAYDLVGQRCDGHSGSGVVIHLPDRGNMGAPNFQRGQRFTGGQAYPQRPYPRSSHPNQRSQDVQKLAACGSDPYCWGALTITQELAEGDILEDTKDNIERFGRDVGRIFGW